MTLVEEYSGVGELLLDGEVRRTVRYRISRYQAMLPSGLPLPGRHRIEGSIDDDFASGSADLIDAPLILRMADGRSLPVSVAATGRVYAEGHGPGIGCSCC